MTPRNSRFDNVRLASLTLLLLGVIAARSFGAQNYYVAASGSDTNAGTQAQPFRQIRKALTVVGPGDTILIADGTYLGFDIDDLSGSNGAPITLQATGTNAIVIPTTDRPDNRDTIFINDAAYITVDGLRSFNANRAALRIQSGHHVTVRNCVFGNNARWGILTGHSPDLLIENNECYGSVAEHGIYVANSADRPVVRGNRCYDNHGSGIQLNADLNTPPGDGIITEALIEQNIIYNNGLNGGGGGGLNLDGVQNSIIRNNLLFTNHASGIILFRIDGAEGPRGNYILHNTIEQAADGRWALGIKQTSGTNYVRNNILLTRHPFRGGLEFASTNDANRTDTDYNVVNRITANDGSTTLTLAQWQAQGKDTHSITGSLAAIFVDSNAGNYLLRTNAAAVNAAQPSAITNDFEGNWRPSGPAADIGCYEQSPLRLHILSRMPGGFQLRLSGGAGRIYEVQRRAGFTNWSTLASLTRSHRPLELSVTNQEWQELFRAAYSH